MTSKVYTDASSAILLYKAGLFGKTATHFQMVLTPGVFAEITRQGHDGAGFFSNFQGIAMEPPDLALGASCLEKALSLDLGEKETLLLFLQQNKLETAGLKRFILVDDGPAAKFCKARGLPFINALLVPKILWLSGHMSLSGCNEKMEFLSKTGRYSPAIIKKALELTAQDLDYFKC